MLIYHPPARPLTPTRTAEDWRALLADPEKQWREGYSARMLAERWEASRPDVPDELRDALRGTPLEKLVPLVAFPEYPVALPGGARASQNNLCVVGRVGADLAVIMIEGKVRESFGPLMRDWLREASAGKLERIASIKDTLGLDGETPLDLRYQLFHRTRRTITTASSSRGSLVPLPRPRRPPSPPLPCSASSPPPTSHLACRHERLFESPLRSMRQKPGMEVGRGCVSRGVWALGGFPRKVTGPLIHMYGLMIMYIRRRP